MTSNSPIPTPEVIKLQFSEAHLRRRLDHLYPARSQTDNTVLLQQVNQIQKQSEELQGQNSFIADLMKEELRLKGEVERVEIKCREMEMELQDVKEKHSQVYVGKEIVSLQLIHKMQMSAQETEKVSLRAKLSSLTEYISERDTVFSRIHSLESALELEKSQHKLELSEMNASQIRATSRLRKEIQTQLEQTKLTLLKMNETQLEASMRLTAEENQKLVSEVDFLSRETEKLLEKNSFLEQEMRKMRKNAEMQNQIEKELVKRAKLCEKLLKEMGKRVNELENTPDLPQNSEIKYDKDLISYMERKIEELTIKNDALEREISSLRTRKSGQNREIVSLVAILRDYIETGSEVTSDLVSL